MRKIILFFALMVFFSHAAWSGEAEKAYQKEDFATAFVLFSARAEKGDTAAMNLVGVMYENGTGIIQNDKQAVRWYRMAAEQGNAYAQYNLGYMYDSGSGITQSDNQAMHWYRMAAEQGNALAQYNLGIIYDFGIVVTRDYKEALRWLHMAAKQGQVESQASLGEYYEYGKGIPPDYSKALFWYREAAKQQNNESEKAVARLSNGAWGTRNLQRLLAAQGFYSGIVDGVFGHSTLAAAREYHKTVKLEFVEFYITGIHNHLITQPAKHSLPDSNKHTKEQ